MKKFLILPALALPLMALSDAQIAEHFQKEVASQLKGFNQNVTARVKSRAKVPGYSSFEYAVLEINAGHQMPDINILIQGDFIYPEAVDVKTGTSLRGKVDSVVFLQGLTPVYKSEKPANIITLGDPKKPTIVMFTDPECPVCRDELKKINETLKNNSLKLILVPVGGLTGLQKSALIYDEIAKAKDDKAKLAVLNKYYDPKATVGKIDEAKVKAVGEQRDKYARAGITKVPMFIDEKEILCK
jgi:thiol:disulfide interchange protein DsbC